MNTGWFQLIVLLVSFLVQGAVDAQVMNKSVCVGISEKQAARHLYLVARATKGKAEMAARYFNLSDSNITHIGIGYTKDSQVIVSHVTDMHRMGETALVTEPLQQFIAAPGTRYISVWEVACSESRFHAVMDSLDNYRRRRIYFDYRFQLDQSDSLYCSEFCARILTIVLNRIPDPSWKKLDTGVLTNLLGRIDFCYYPVDFFQGYSEVSLLESRAVIPGQTGTQ